MPAWLIQLIVGVILTVASVILDTTRQHDQRAAQRRVGFRGTTQTGGDSPLTFIIGRYATAGHRIYPRTAWGNSGGTPNEFLVDIIGASGLPIRGYAGHFVFGERVTLDTENEDASLGYPVLEYRDASGKDHLWVKEYDGTQTEADAYLLNKFGSHPERPWLSDMVGVGLAYCIYTARVNPELFPNAPEYVMEVDGYELTDPRGDDEQENPVVMIEELLSGFYIDGLWIYGPQNISSNRRPYANGAETEMDKCDESISLSGGGSEKRFRAGMEISCDTEPHIYIGELLKACSGRIAEVGGKYKLLVGEPNAPVLSFTDEDILITEGQRYTPFPKLKQTHNEISSSFPDPAAAYQMKPAPVRKSSEYVAQDGGFSRPFQTQYKAVPFANQVQRLDRTAIEEARRFRRHSFTGGPEWWEIEPLDATEWTSGHNGYDDKLGLITVIEDGPDGDQVVGWQEQDADDYPWSTAYELPYITPALGISRPAPQLVTAPQFEPAFIPDNDGNGRRPGIALTNIPEGLVDVRAWRIQVRLSGGGALVFDAPVEYSVVDTDISYLLNGVFTSLTNYEGRYKPLPLFSNRETLWSNQEYVSGELVEGAWLGVTTPYAPLTSSDLSPAMNAVRDDAMKKIIEIEEYLRTIDISVAAQDVSNREEIVAKFGEAAALVVQEARARADQYGSLAEAITTVTAQYNDVSGTGYFATKAEVDEEGGTVLVTLAARKTSSGTAVESSFSIYIDEEDNDFIFINASKTIFTGQILGGDTLVIDTDTGGLSIQWTV